MQYIIFNDFINFFKNKKKLLITYFLIIIIIFLFKLVHNVEITNNIIYEILGLKCIFYEQDWIQIIVYTFIMVFYVYLSMSVFIKDLKNNLSNIFLRINPTKWLLYKTLSIMFIDGIIMIITYLLVMLLYSTFNSMINFNWFIIFNNYLYILIIQFIFLIFYIVYSKLPILAILSLIILFVLLYPYTSVIQIPIMSLVFFVALSYFVLIWVNNLFYIDVFEGS